MLIQNKQMKLGYDDVSILPDVLSDISSRKECNPYDENGMLPIFASPMAAVVCEENIPDFLDNKINVVIPRTIYPTDQIAQRIALGKKYDCFVAISLSEAQQIIDDFTDPYGQRGWARRGETYKICIDLANGHMSRLLDICSSLKKLEGVFFTIMTGNIANPETYRAYENAGIDYVRVGIGGGSGCLTASNTGTYFPMFSLIEETAAVKQRISGKCKIIADGGIKGYRDIQKALLFADYVMIGGLFNRAIESAGKATYGNSYYNVNGKKIFRPFKTLFTYGREIKNRAKAFKLFKEDKLSIWKEFYGMSTKKAQTLVDPKAKTKTSEGKIFRQKVEYDLRGWVENETDYLRSAMSYTNSRTLKDFRESGYVLNNSIVYNK